MCIEELNDLMVRLHALGLGCWAWLISIGAILVLWEFIFSEISGFMSTFSNINHRLI